MPAGLESVRTLPDLFARRVALTPQAEAYRQFDAKAGAWAGTTWKEAGERVARWTRALAALDLPHGARVAILLPNGLDAVCIDQAALALGCVPVPLHAIDNPGSIAYILADCDASVLMVSARKRWEDIVSVGTPLPALVRVIVSGMKDEDADAAGLVVSLERWLEGGKEAGPALPPPAESDLASIVYTSGTTGKPKGVMLTHRNVISNIKSTLARVSPTMDDVFLSFLPLSHTFERTVGYYLPIAIGACVAYSRSVPQLGEDLRTVRPTVLISVPRIYERIYARVQEALAKSRLKAALFDWTQAVGWRRFCREQNPAVEAGAWAWLDPVVWPALKAAVADPLLAQFGGRVRIAVSGGAALSAPIARCFLGLGLPVLQGYGMTETSPVVAANAPGDNDPATVGRALRDVEVRLGDNQELLVRGPSVMKGYWKRPADTAQVLSADGWLRTGDQAAIADGRIRILGRIKEIIVTSTGEKVPPGDLESALTDDPLFEQAFVVGENRPFIAAVVVLNRDEWRRLAAGLGVDPEDAASLAAPAVLKAALERIARRAKDFPRYAVPRKVLLTLEPWTIENTFMTPTLKLKRNNLMGHFAAGIDALYGSGGV
ncbi:MAG: long-chain fatty acid--CoA ligase [Proteobacteria bacterium]|nr:long-chain fatty acid--CoA ligase [Pseudomonadota bacterium]